MEGNAYPEIKNEALVRSKDIIQLFEKVRVNDTVPRISDGVVCEAFRRFLLYLKIKSTGAPTTIRYEVQFLEPRSGAWCSYNQGVFAALYYEDGDTATEVNECFEGECMGREFRVKITGVGTTSVAYFVTSVSVEFRN